MADVAILGSGSWGTTLALVACRAGARVRLWARDPAAAAAMRESRLNPGHLGDTPIPSEIGIESDLSAAVRDAGIVVFAVPCAAMRGVARLSEGRLPERAILVSAAKGFEQGTLRAMTEVIREECGGSGRPVAVLSGPNLAREIAAGKPAATVIAVRDASVAAQAAATFSSARFRAYTSDDVTGVELAGALKNVIALAAGMGDELDAGDNGKAALMTRGLAEVARLGTAMGADPLTFAGLAGMGDLIATCSSPLSRNNRAGRMLAQGVAVAEIAERLGEVAEGIPTAASAVALGERHGVQMPIAREVAAVIAGSTGAEEAVARLMGRALRAERD